MASPGLNAQRVPSVPSAPGASQSDLSFVWEGPRARLRRQLFLKMAQTHPDFELAADRACSTAHRLGLPSWPRSATKDTQRRRAPERGHLSSSCSHGFISPGADKVSQNQITAGMTSSDSTRCESSVPASRLHGRPRAANRDADAFWLSNDQRDFMHVISSERRAAQMYVRSRGPEDMHAATMTLSSSWRKACDPKAELSLPLLHMIVPPVTIEDVVARGAPCAAH